MIKWFKCFDREIMVKLEKGKAIVYESWKYEGKNYAINEKPTLTIEEVRYLLDEMTAEIPPETQISFCPRPGLIDRILGEG